MPTTIPTYLPEWAEDDTTFVDGTPNKSRPASPLRQFGTAPLSLLNCQEFNYQMNLIGQWIAYLSEQVTAPSQKAIGELFLVSGDSRNPSEILGYGTWVRAAEGRTIIGAGTGVDVNGTSQNFTDGQTVGEYNVKLTTDQIPQHSHTGGITGPTGGPTARVEGYPAGAPASDNYVPTSTGATGGSQSHNNVQPSFVCYVWKRTA